MTMFGEPPPVLFWMAEASASILSAMTSSFAPMFALSERDSTRSPVCKIAGRSSGRSSPPSW